MSTVRGEHAFESHLAWRLDGPTADPEAPLVLALHGRGMDEDAFALLLQPLFRLPCRVLTPRAPFPIEMRREKRIGASWYAYDGDAVRFARELARTEDLLLGLLRDVESAQGLRPRRRALLGFSQGGYCGAVVALRNPDVFDALVVSGARVKSEILEADLPRAAASGMRVLLGHGRHDEHVPYEFAERGRAALAAAGIDVALQAFDSGHVLDRPQLAAIAAWLRDAMLQG